MAEEELENAQKELRVLDYDSSSSSDEEKDDDTDERSPLNNSRSFSPSTTSASGLGLGTTMMMTTPPSTDSDLFDRGTFISVTADKKEPAAVSVAASFDPYSTHPLDDDNILGSLHQRTSATPQQAGGPTTSTSSSTSSSMFRSHIIVSDTPTHQFPLQQSRLASRIPAPNSLFDDDDSTAAVELPTFTTIDNNNINNNTNNYDYNIANATTSNNNRYSNGVIIHAGTVPPATEIMMINTTTTTRATSSVIPGAAGYLEMEEEPPRSGYNNNHEPSFLAPSGVVPRQQQQQQQPRQIPHPKDNTEPIRTDSGLLLTHRKSPATMMKHRSHQQQQYHPSSQPTTYSQPYPQQHNQQQHSHFPHMAGRTFRTMQQDYFEVENGFWGGWRRILEGSGRRQYGTGGGGVGNDGRHSMATVQTKRLMSFVKLWVVLFALVLLAMTGAFWHSLGHKESTVSKRDVDGKTTTTTTTTTNNVGTASGGYYVNGGRDTNRMNAPQEILLLPLDDVSKLATRQQKQFDLGPLQLGYSRHGATTTAATTSTHHGHRFLMDLRDEFETWMKEHGKVYHSETEKEHRFTIWTQNHHRTMEKNRRHGLCSLTQQPVFGSNRWKDLTPEEFKAAFLTGYSGILTDELEEKMRLLPPDVRQLRMESGRVLDPDDPIFTIHESVKRRQLQYIPRTDPIQAGSSSGPNCKWYDLSCYLRWIWRSTGIQFGSFIRVMEPKYDSSSYPNLVDWRDSGAVTAVRTQGDCGACWAITAVETVESAHYLSTGSLYNLAESEVIVCDDSCKMCDGGWPQNAYEWVMDHGGLPLLEDFEYDAATLNYLTDAGDTYETLETYRSSVCPASDKRSRSRSGDNSYWEDGKENKNYNDYSGQGRYGNIKGYGYATNRCVCYSDGSGCDCRDQDEDLAVRNVATYGPAAVCLDASLWQDYRGGIITSALGCGQEFLSMNHCVQVVGYAFTTDSDSDSDCEGEGCAEQQSRSRSRNSRSGDSDNRNGYWIVRNQWGENWGMSGYAYVAMGENTCGILNDMTQAYL